MTKFRPCIDLHSGQVKQIVGATLKDDGSAVTNFVATQTADHFARLYKQDGLSGAHVIMLGPNNEEAAKLALETWPQGLQVGGGITIDNAEQWLQAGADKLIVTSWLFEDGCFSEERARALCDRVGRDRLVFDLSCRKKAGEAGWFVAIKRWQVVTDLQVDEATLHRLSQYCCEFLVHAADVEGLCQGIDEELVACLGKWSPIPCTYAGGAKDVADLDRVAALSDGQVDLTFGSALDIFGGSLVRYEDCVAWNKAH
ncbi:5-proFAR isomerase His6 [Salpingoeca rosetta]|uniref:1-(5-phosphoribosyl)-5-[(5-phosphoribosylamino)methylideneamino]imidazole-4-carboxamideisomerase n=1 Tax=Salpingoeca rosetta (strain ATCC 50818 / BSB-021) TaxID=946362 RepID=F2UFH2_SALR5|nr:5-proFAR isomerase His6 [Salpingoeca rosetta]EGD75540.1 5-proFAR isomerase His6 [Salpingoeca rosetta]|eukprot:XP_004991997.1 5-proFAR isomerase His6 [Salpingoeca rosetta]